MKVVYIAHCLGAGPDRDRNLENAARWVVWAARSGVAPVADWIALAALLEETPENRELGLTIDRELVERCDEVWLVGGRVSEGMQIEIDHAMRHGILVVDLTHLGYEPPAEPWVERDVLPEGPITVTAGQA